MIVCVDIVKTRRKIFCIYFGTVQRLLFFWHKVSAWLAEQGCMLPLSSINIMWGFQEEQSMLLNTIVLLGKAFIFNNQKHLILENFISFLKHHYLLTKIMRKNEKKHNRCGWWLGLAIAGQWNRELS